QIFGLLRVAQDAFTGAYPGRPGQPGDNVGAMPDYSPDPQVVPYLLYEDAGAAMDWLISVFGFTERVRDQLSDGTVRHGELLLDNGGVIMLGSPGADFRGPAKLGERPQVGRLAGHQ